MTFTKGMSKVGGRKKGTRNKVNSELNDLLKKYDCDPILGMIKIAINEGEKSELRFQCYKELAQYKYPKKKAVEVDVYAHTRPTIITDMDGNIKEVLGSEIQEET